MLGQNTQRRRGGRVVAPTTHSKKQSGVLPEGFIQSNSDKWNTFNPCPTVPYRGVSHIEELGAHTKHTVPQSVTQNIR